METSTEPPAAPEGWAVVDADDRWPGRFTAYARQVEDFTLRITPGDSATYEAPGFEWTATHPYVSGMGMSGRAETVADAARQADEAVDYVVSGQAEADAYAGEYDQGADG